MLDIDFPMVEFTAHDRCDGCGAQAYTEASREDMPASLLFCFHHRKQCIKSLEDEGWTVVDDYEALSRLSDKNYVGV